jgi:rRNA-processing protein EBP2
MAKKNKSKKTKKERKNVEQEEPEPEEEISFQKVTLDQIDAMSDGEEDEIEEWNAEAKALRQAIAEGAFDKMNLNEAKKENAKNNGDEDDEDEETSEVEEIDEAAEDEVSTEEGSDEDEDEGENEKLNAPSNIVNIKALTSVASQLVAQKESLPWPEKMDVIPSTPLPFGQKTEEGLIIHVHDDLKREVAFYNLALQSVYTARTQCEKLNIAFSRPEDFFAEMVKTDGTFFICRFLRLCQYAMEILEAP